MNFPRLPSRTLRWSILAALVALGLGGILATLLADHSLKVAPAAYLVALENNTLIRLRWKTRKLPTSMTLPANAVVSIPADKKVLIVYPDGRQETVTGPRRIQIPTPPPSDFDFLALPLTALSLKPTEGTLPLDGAIRVTSPVGVTRFRNPTLAWTARADTSYDVAVVDPADEAAPPRIARDVRPPIPLSSLETTQNRILPVDRIFAVLVRVKGEVGLGGAGRFLTAPEATTEDLPSEPAALLAEAVSALTHKPSRTGDAWLALSRLPDPWPHCDLALRLRLRVSTELGLTEELKKLNTEMGRQ